MVINKTYKYLMAQKNSSYNDIVLSIINQFVEYGKELSEKQENMVARLYWTKVYEYKKPTKKMIEDNRKEAAMWAAREDERSRLEAERLFASLSQERKDD